MTKGEMPLSLHCSKCGFQARNWLEMDCHYEYTLHKPHKSYPPCNKYELLDKKEKPFDPKRTWYEMNTHLRQNPAQIACRILGKCGVLDPDRYPIPAIKLGEMRHKQPEEIHELIALGRPDFGKYHTYFWYYILQDFELKYRKDKYFCNKKQILGKNCVEMDPKDQARMINDIERRAGVIHGECLRIFEAVFGLAEKVWHRLNHYDPDVKYPTDLNYIKYVHNKTIDIMLRNWEPEIDPTDRGHRDAKRSVMGLTKRGLFPVAHCLRTFTTSSYGDTAHFKWDRFVIQKQNETVDAIRQKLERVVEAGLFKLGPNDKKLTRKEKLEMEEVCYELVVEGVKRRLR